jgi:hypothetical protein
MIHDPRLFWGARVVLIFVELARPVVTHES